MVNRRHVSASPIALFGRQRFERVQLRSCVGVLLRDHDGDRSLIYLRGLQ